MVRRMIYWLERMKQIVRINKNSAEKKQVDTRDTADAVADLAQYNIDVNDNEMHKPMTENK